MLGKVDTRAKAMAREVKRWLKKYTNRLVNEEIDRLKAGYVTKNRRRVRKANLTSDERELLDLFTKYGVRQTGDSAREWNPAFIITPRRMDAFIREKEIKIQRLSGEIRDEFRANVGIAIADWLKETPIPSVGEVARRLRTSFFTDGGVPLKPIKGGTGMARDLAGRAELIARTELGMARNRGALEGMQSAGIREKEWVAVTSDRKSGDRRHYKMDGVRIPVDAKFELPDGTEMEGPGMGPIKHTANCRSCHCNCRWDMLQPTWTQ